MMICLLSTFSVYTLTPLTLRGCRTNTQRHDGTRQRRHKRFPISRLALSTSSTLFLTQRGNYLRNERICLRRARVFRSMPPRPTATPQPTPPAVPPAAGAVVFFVCLLSLSAVGCNSQRQRAGAHFLPDVDLAEAEGAEVGVALLYRRLHRLAEHLLHKAADVGPHLLHRLRGNTGRARGRVPNEGTYRAAPCPPINLSSTCLLLLHIFFYV